MERDQHTCRHALMRAHLEHMALAVSRHGKEHIRTLCRPGCVVALRGTGCASISNPHTATLAPWSSGMAQLHSSRQALDVLKQTRKGGIACGWVPSAGADPACSPPDQGCAALHEVYQR